jgi:hypothetical protein
MWDGVVADGVESYLWDWRMLTEGILQINAQENDRGAQSS